MERLFRLFSRLLRDDDFRRFQCDVADSAYEQLSRGYLANEDEVALVGRLVKATNGRSYGPLIHIHADKIRGGRSSVEFKCQDKPVTKDQRGQTPLEEGARVRLSGCCGMSVGPRPGGTDGSRGENVAALHATSRRITEIRAAPAGATRFECAAGHQTAASGHRGSANKRVGS